VANADLAASYPARAARRSACGGGPKGRCRRGPSNRRRRLTLAGAQAGYSRKLAPIRHI